MMTDEPAVRVEQVVARGGDPQLAHPGAGARRRRPALTLEPCVHFFSACKAVYGMEQTGDSTRQMCMRARPVAPCWRGGSDLHIHIGCPLPGAGWGCQRMQHAATLAKKIIHWPCHPCVFGWRMCR